jgi:hypothetical protein
MLTPKPRAKSRLARVALCVVLLLLLAWLASWTLGLSGQICNQQAATQQSECPSYNLVFVVLWHLIEIANWLSPALTALATIAIGYFTWTIWHSGEDTTKLVKKQADIAEAQHLAEHRPHLRVRHVFLGTPQVPLHSPNINSEISGGLVVVNVGGTKAKIVDSRYLIHFARTQNGLPMHSPLDDSWTEIFARNSSDLGIGESRSFGIVGNVSVEPIETARSTFISFGNNEWTVYVMGQIQYQDDGENDRFMGFCRRWSGNGTFEAVPDPDYEYED